MATAATAVLKVLSDVKPKYIIMFIGSHWIHIVEEDVVHFVNVIIVAVFPWGRILGSTKSSSIECLLLVRFSLFVVDFSTSSS